MAVVFEQGESFADLQKKNTIQNEDEDVGFFESALAGVATGLWNIPKGFVSLGAELFDLVGDTDTAKGVEEWFDEVNPFDDEAEARTIGKITQAITQIAPLAVSGFALGAKAGQKVSRSLPKRALAARNTQLDKLVNMDATRIAKRALAAKRAGRSFSLSNTGRKIMGKTSGGIIGGGSNHTNLGDLFIYDQLFGGSSSIIGDGNNNLGDLFVIDQLFGGDNGVIGDGDGGSNLGELFILDKLFDNDSILDRGGTDLGDLFILDQLF